MLTLVVGVLLLWAVMVEATAITVYLNVKTAVRTIKNNEIWPFNDCFTTKYGNMYMKTRRSTIKKREQTARACEREREREKEKESIRRVIVFLSACICGLAVWNLILYRDRDVDT